MDVQDQTTHTSPSGHENHGVYLCHRCGWPFPNPHPSAKHRRAHKKICGTIEGYTDLNRSEVVSDDDHHPDDDKEKTPSPKIDKKGGGDGEISGSFSRSEDELFADAVTEFADSGTTTRSANKSMDKDLFFSFKDAENAGTNEALNDPTEISKVDASIEVSEKTDPHVEKTNENEIRAAVESSDSNLELTRTGGLVEEGGVGPTSEPSHVSQSEEAKSIVVMEAAEEKGQESMTSETITEEAKDSAITKTTPEVSATNGGYHDDVKQEDSEKLESVTTDGISEEIRQDLKDSEITKTTPDVSAIVGGFHDNVKQEKFEKLESATTNGINEEIQQENKPDCEHVSEAVKESETVEGIKTEQSELDRDIAPEVVKESEIDHFQGVEEEIKHEKSEPDHKHVAEVDKDSETDQNLSVRNAMIQDVVKEPVAVSTETKDFEAPEFKESSTEHIQEAVKEPVEVLIENKDLGGPQLEKESIEHPHEIAEEPDSVLTGKYLDTPKLEGSPEEQIQEVMKQPDTVLTEKEDLGGPHLEKQPKEHTHEVVVEKPHPILTEKDIGTPKLEPSSKEHIQEVVKEPNTVLTEKEDLGAAHLEAQSNEHTNEVVEKTDPILAEKKDLGASELKKCTEENIVEEPHSVLTEKEDLGAHNSEKCSKDEVIEQKVYNDRNLVAEVSTETITPKDSSDISITNGKNASGVALEPAVEEGDAKLMNNQDSGADLAADSSSLNSLEGNWGSVSVLSTASIDAESLQSTEKSKVNSGKSNAATSDVFEPPSFMTLVEPESKNEKTGSSEVQDSQHQPNSASSKAGWFPTLTNVNNDSEGRKKNEEVMAKVTNWSTGKQSAPLKNLLGEARSPSGKQPEPVVQKDEDVVNPLVNNEVSSPPKLIEEGKDGRKKVKGRSSWVPFVCCSSVNVK